MHSTEHIPFSISTSPNAELFVFHEYWSYSKHYHAVFNAQAEVLPRAFPAGQPWGLIADWRKWLVQVPEAERLCARSVGKFQDKGMTHYAAVCEDHPIAKWQCERIQQQNPGLHCRIFTSFDEAYAWFTESGFDVNFNPVSFDEHWLQPSALFEQLLRELNVSKKAFPFIFGQS